MKGLWSFVVLIACSLIQLNLVLIFELNLVDLKTSEPSIIYYLLEATTNVKLYVLNEQISFMKTSNNFDIHVANEIRNETMVTAIEHSASQASLAVTKKHLPLPIGEIGHIFQLRSIPLRSFILPKTISIEEFSSIDIPTSSIDECLMWIDKAVKNFPPERMNGSLIHGDLMGLKKALLTNKISILKSSESAGIHTNKHPFIVSSLNSL
jgi:hypothetical protein